MAFFHRSTAQIFQHKVPQNNNFTLNFHSEICVCLSGINRISKPVILKYLKNINRTIAIIRGSSWNTTHFEGF